MAFFTASGEHTRAPEYVAAPVTVAVLAEDGRVLQATQALADRTDVNGERLAIPSEDLERVLRDDAARVATTLDGEPATLYALVSITDERLALLTLAGPEPARPSGGRHPLLDEPLDGTDAIVWLKDLDGRYLRINRAFEAQLGTTAGEVVGERDADLGPGRTLDAARLADDDAPKHEPLELEYTVPAAAGRPAHAVLRFALRDIDGQPSGVCGVAAPLTQAALARAEGARLMRVDRWSRASTAAITAELIEGWGYAYADSLTGAPGREDALEWPELDELIAERDAALSSQAELEAQVVSLRAELDSQLDGLQGELAEARAEIVALSARADAAEAAAPGPRWDGSAQRALASTLAGVQEWRSALERAVKVLGSEGGWDGVMAWSTDGQRGVMSCTAATLSATDAAPRLETQVWQHRPSLSSTEFGRARTRQAATCLLELSGAEDTLLRAAGEAGMTSAVLVPVHDGTETVAILALLSASTSPPDGDLMLALEAVGLQLGAVAQLLAFAAAPRWRLGRA